MLGNGIANIVAAGVLAGAIVWTGGFSGGKPDRMSEEELARVYARAVGDIRNDIVVNCGCCGDEGQRSAQARPF